MRIAGNLACLSWRGLTRSCNSIPVQHLNSLYSTAATKVDAVVVGAGVVGLAVGRALAVRRMEVVVVDAADNIGTETSARNSIYYPPGSLKSRLCVAGKHLLYKFCQDYDVPHSNIGKLVVATSQEQLAALKALQCSAEAAGVPLEWLSGDEARRLEPEVRCQAALLSPTTGIVDSHSLMVELHRQLEEAGGTLALRSRIVGGCVSSATIKPPTYPDRQPGAAHPSTSPAMPPSDERALARGSMHSSSGGREGGGGILLQVRDAGSGEELELEAGVAVNAAGMWAQDVASSLRGLDPGTIPKRYLAKGSYFSLAGRPPFRHLIYPLPEASTAGLGTHLTLDLGGQAKFGPNVEWLPEGQDPHAIDYTVDPSLAESFYPAIRAYWPGLPSGSLHPSYSGVRPKVSGPEMVAGDFIIQGPAQHGVAGLVNLYGIESPGLTASLAIAEQVAEIHNRK